MADLVIVGYFLVYMAVNSSLLFESARQVRRQLLRDRLFGGEDGDERTDHIYPLVSLLVPAYCEEVTIVDNVRSLLQLSYPRLEIVVVNDGSSDSTVRTVRDAFLMERTAIDYDAHLATAPVRGFYESRSALPDHVERLVLIDKENGGKADAINAGLNGSRGAYVATMDADSLLRPDSVRRVMDAVLDDPNGVLACGAQVALTNGSTVEGSRLRSVRFPQPWIARFQVIEYLRSFTQARTPLAAHDSLLILSGVFALFQRAALISVGGFLTRRMQSRVGREYCGPEAETVCEDMEIIVRLHRYFRDRDARVRTLCMPLPLAWTEAPEVWTHLGKQRNRWYRGLWEVLRLHRRMLFRRRFGRVGLFALPYQLFYEALAPIVETLGYIILPLSAYLGILSWEALIAFVMFALAFNLALSAGSVHIAVRRMSLDHTTSDCPLVDYRGSRTLALMVWTSFLSNIGYRQYLIAWQLRGLWDFLRGRTSWDKFSRKGFNTAPAAV